MYAFPRIAGRIRHGTAAGRRVRSPLRSVPLLAALAVDPVALVLIAPLEGLGFASVFVGGVTVLAAHAPAGLQGTAQGTFAACSGLATIIGSIVGGAIAGALSIPALFFVCAAVSLAGTGHRRDRAPRPGHGPDPTAGSGAPSHMTRIARSCRQSKRASRATSSTRSMNRYSHSRALISAILPASAGCVLTSRSWSSEATA